MTAAGDNWIVVRAVANCRVWNTETGQYHRGCDGAVRVYRDAQAAQRRADILHGIVAAPYATGAARENHLTADSTNQ